MRVEGYYVDGVRAGEWWFWDDEGTPTIVNY